MSLAELLLKMDNQYSGHYQTVITGLTLEQGMELCKELEEYVDNQYSFVLELWTCGGFTIYKKDGLGSGIDQMIVSNN